jgi:Domain of unknown function (DUF1876)
MRPGLRMWRIEVVFTEQGDVTKADARLEVADHHYHGQGRAWRNPADPDRPRIGEEVAAARALSDLSRHLRRAASEDIGSFEGHLVAVHP